MTMRTPLSRVRGLGSAKEGTDHFWKQRLTGVANVPLMIFFVFLIVSMVGADHTTAAAIVASPFVAILLLLVIFSGLYHMRLGMQTIIEDYVNAEGAKIVLLMGNTFFCVAIGAACVFAVLKVSFGG
ncbi:MAG: succinate dehydrogenase, hydrophobic membrane anchor protein [Pseudomonadota bacterium]